MPTCRQLSRRSKHGQNAFTRRFDGYSGFKVRAIEHLLSTGKLSEETRVMLRTHLDNLKGERTNDSEAPPPPHAKGRHLGFRAFAFAPTYEAEVVSLFSSIADELGFEIKVFGERIMIRRTAFHLDCTSVLAECECTCGKCIEEMKTVFEGTPGVGRFYREGHGVVLEHDPGVIAVEQLMEIFRRLPSFYRGRFVPSLLQESEGQD